MALIFPELYYDKIELVGVDVVDGNEYYNIKIDTDIEILNYLIDKDDFTIFRVLSDGYIMEILETEIVDGIKLIKSSKSIHGNDTMTGNTIDCQLNVDINDSIFELK